MVSLSLLVYQCRQPASSAPATTSDPSALGDGWTAGDPAPITGANIYTTCANTSNIPVEGTALEYENPVLGIGHQRTVATFTTIDAATDMVRAWSDDPWSCARGTGIDARRLAAPDVDGADATVMWALDYGAGSSTTQRVAVARFDDTLVIVSSTGPIIDVAGIERSMTTLLND
jgi:hypothetical protein